MVPRRAPHVDARRRRVHAGPRLPRRVDGVRRPQLRGDDGLRLALLFAGLYCLARGTLTGSSPIFLALGGLALGLAVAARPSLAIAGAFVAVAAVLVLRAPQSVRRRTALLVALLAPYAAIGALILLYNQARFGSFFEFGQSYQLSLFNPRTYPYDSFSYVPKGLYYYLFSPGRVGTDFPYLFLRKNEYAPALVAQPGFDQ